MATVTIIQNSNIGYTHLFELVANYLGDSSLDVDEVCKDVIKWVNRNLPDSFFWNATASELIAEETEEMDEKEFMEYVTDGIINCANDPEEELCTTLPDAQRTEIQMNVCKELVGDDYMNLFEAVDPTDIWDMDRYLTGRKNVNFYEKSLIATVKEYKNAFRDFFERCI